MSTWKRCWVCPILPLCLKACGGCHSGCSVSWMHFQIMSWWDKGQLTISWPSPPSITAKNTLEFLLISHILPLRTKEVTPVSANSKQSILQPEWGSGPNDSSCNVWGKKGRDPHSSSHVLETMSDQTGKNFREQRKSETPREGRKLKCLVKD